MVEGDGGGSAAVIAESSIGALAEGRSGQCCDETAPKERIRNATRVAMKNLVDYALEEKVDFLVIAGDLYDGDWSDYATGHILLGQLRRMAPTPVYVIHGNHDALSRMTRSLPMPPFRE